MGGQRKENRGFPRKCLHLNSQFCNHVRMQFYFTQKNNVIDLTKPKSGSNCSDAVQLSHIFPHRYFCLIAHWFHCSLLSIWICCEKSSSCRLNIRRFWASFQAPSLPRAVWNTGVVGRISPGLRLDLVAPVSEALAVAREATWAPLSHICPSSLPFAGPCWHPSSAIPLGMPVEQGGCLCASAWSCSFTSTYEAFGHISPSFLAQIYEILRLPTPV